MNSDYKWRYQMEAEELAFELYNRDFYDLPAELQDVVYRRGMEADWAKQEAAADALRDKEQEDARSD